MKKIFLTSFLILIAFGVFGQINSDSIFNSAIENARQGDYEKALGEALPLMDVLPDRYDISIFISNVFAWKGDYSSAKNQINKAYAINKTSKELYDAWLNILLWSEDYQKLIEVADLAKQNGYANDYNLTLKKSIAYKEMGKYPDGVYLIETNKRYLDSTKISHLYNEMLILNKSKAVTLYYSPTFFDYNSLKPQHLSYIDYSFKVKNQIFIPRINYAYRFGTSDLLVESDYYRLFNNGQYLYANFGMSVLNKLFPDYRGGLEFYSPIGNSMEASVGGRYLYAGKNNIYILTGHLSKYVNNFWFSLRPYYAIQNTKNTITIAAHARYYEANPINYWGLELLYGTSPDERAMILQSTDAKLLNSYRVKIEKNIAVFKTNEIKLTSAYTYEEYDKGTYGNRFTFEVFLKHKF